MNSKYKLMTILGTRPEIIRLASVIKSCDRHFNHTLVHTGQNWDPLLSDIFFSDLSLRKPDIYLDVVGDHLGQTLGRIIEKSYECLEREKPDALLILGDTNSALSAIAAKRLKIPIFHMEAGNRCFDQNLPEEINRKIVDHISDVNLPYTEHGRRYLFAEGLPKEYIFVTGSPMVEVLKSVEDKIAQSDILNKLGLQENEYILVSAHREENVTAAKKFRALCDSLNEVAETYQKNVIFSVHPRTANRIKEEGIKFHSLVKEMQPFGFIDYNHLQKKSFCVLSDSGTISEESAILGFPAVILRTSTERPEAIDAGSIVISGVEPLGVINSISLVRELHQNQLSESRQIYDYTDCHVSSKVTGIISSYINIIRKNTWDLPAIQK